MEYRFIKALNYKVAVIAIIYHSEVSRKFRASEKISLGFTQATVNFY